MTLDDYITDLVRRIVREELATLHPAPPAEPPTFKPSGEYVDDRELAAWIGLSLETVQQWRGRGEGPPFIKMGPRCVRYHVPAVREWMERRRRG